MYSYPMCIDTQHIYYVGNDTYSTILNRIHKKTGTITKIFDINTISRSFHSKPVTKIRNITCDETYIYVYISGESYVHPYIYKINKKNLSDVSRFVL
jgi:hypothetical protein